MGLGYSIFIFKLKNGIRNFHRDSFITLNTKPVDAWGRVASSVKVMI